MDNNTLLIALAAVIVIAIILLVVLKGQRSKKLRSQFGTEYERTVQEAGGRKNAELELREREKRVHKFDLHPLTAEDRSRYGESWRLVQADFVDDPKGAVTRADVLLDEVMRARGYPAAEFDERAANLSVEHPTFIENYRAAHDISERHARGEAGTEDLRQAMIHYRALFDDLVSASPDDAARRPAAGRAVT